jgi:glycosyltransferase involved in cell wall biosynthesis
VASAIGSFPELIGHREDGWLVPPLDSAALADAVERLHADPALASELGASARQTYEERFRPDANLELLESIYDRVLAQAFA